MPNENPSKILIIRLSSLGDVLLTTPLIRSVRKKYPKANLDFLVKPQFADAIRFNPYLNEIIEYNRQKPRETIAKLRKGNYDLVIDLQNNLRSRRVRKVLKCESFVFKKPTFEKFMLVHFKKNYFGGVFPIPLRYIQSVKGLEPDSEGLDLFLPEEVQSVLEEDKRYVGLCPGAKHFTKRYPSDYFIELGRKLVEYGLQPVIFGGRDDKEICEEVARGVEGAINLCNDNKLFQTAVEMRKCKFVVCNDSGLMHVAAAVRTPVAAIFGSTVREFGFVPFGVKHIVVENNQLDCRPCTHIGKSKCPKKHFECMRSLTPALVFEEIKKFSSEL